MDKARHLTIRFHLAAITVISSSAFVRRQINQALRRAARLSAGNAVPLPAIHHPTRRKRRPNHDQPIAART
jgi:hypothetical protein